MMIIIIKRRRDNYSGKKGGLGLTENELFVHEILVERSFKNLCKNISALLPPTFAPQGFREKWDFGMKNLETDILWTFLIQNWLLEKTISFQKDHTGEVLTTLIYVPSSTKADVGLIQPWAAVLEVAVLKCLFFHWCGRVFRGLFCKKVEKHDFLVFFTEDKGEEVETKLRGKMQHMPFSKNYLTTPTWKIPEMFWISFVCFQPVCSGAAFGILCKV